jgi:predicted GTPase
MLPQKQSKGKKIKKRLTSLFTKKKEEKIAISTEIATIKTEASSVEENLNRESNTSFNEKPITIFLIGSTGKGKSTLANVLINKANEKDSSNFEEVFKESQASVSGTREIQKEEFVKNNINYVTIDTVGLGDTKLKREEVLDKIAEAVYFAREGISQIFLVIGGRFDEKEMANYDLLKSIIFDQEVVNHTTIIRTNFKNFEDKVICQEDIDKMIEEGGKLAKIIQSCQQRVIHVNNPPLKLTPDDDEDAEEEKKRIDKEIKEALNKRSKSGDKLLDHLQQVCQKDFYQPTKLQSLSDEIFTYMEEKIKKREGLAKKETERRKKLGKIQSEKKIKKIDEQLVEDNKSEIEIINSIGEQVEEINLQQLITDNSELKEKEKIGPEESEKERENRRKILIKSGINVLENQLQKLNKTKELIEGIQRADEQIRQIVFNHIFNNIEEINQVTGSEFFLNSFANDSNESLTNKLTITELLAKRKELEVKLSGKKDDNQSLEKIKEEIKKKEQELLKFKKELLTIKEITEKWQEKGFTVVQSQEWADVLKRDFNPETDVAFCVWLRDNKKITVEKLSNYNHEDIEKLRIEATEILATSDQQKLIDNKDKTILLIGSTGKGKSTLANVLVNQANQFTEIFKESGASVSGTREIQSEEFVEKGINYSIIDTVGLGDTKLKREVVLDKIAEAVYLAQQGVNQVFFVIDEKFNPQEMSNYDLLKSIIFDDQVIAYTTIIRTRFANFKDKQDCQADIEAMIKQEGKLAEIIQSCQKRVVYVDNPSLHVLPDDAEDEAGQQAAQQEATEEIASRKETRQASRAILLEHLNNNCQNSPYQPEKLTQLSNDIAADYLQYLTKKKELERELKEVQHSPTHNQSTTQVAVTSESATTLLTEEPTTTKSEPKTVIISHEDIALLQDKKSRLQREISEKETAIRQKVLKHIFNNYQNISQELGSGIFLSSVTGDHDWTAIHPDFKPEIILKWLKEGFSFWTNSTMSWSPQGLWF